MFKNHWFSDRFFSRLIYFLKHRKECEWLLFFPFLIIPITHYVSICSPSSESSPCSFLWRLFWSKLLPLHTPLLLSNPIFSSTILLSWVIYLPKPPKVVKLRSRIGCFGASFNAFLMYFLGVPSCVVSSCSISLGPPTPSPPFHLLQKITFLISPTQC